MNPLPLAELNQYGSNAPLEQLSKVHTFSPSSDLGASRFRYTYAGACHLDALLINQGSDVLIVQFHGAVNREKVQPPRFERLATLRGHSYSCLFVADPGLWLDPEISIAWYTGWAGADVQADIANWIRAAASRVGAKRVLIIGDSGGGFGALQVSALVPDSVCVAFNPTTTIHKYFTSGNYRRTEVQRRYVEVVHPEVMPNDSSEFDPRLDWTVNLGDDVSCLKRYSKRTDNWVLFIQNVNDWHYQQHYLPFLGACARGDNLRRLRCFEYEGKKGHFSPSPGLYRRGLEAGLELIGLTSVDSRLAVLEFSTSDLS